LDERPICSQGVRFTRLGRRLTSDHRAARNTNVWRILHALAVSGDCVPTGQSEIRTILEESQAKNARQTGSATLFIQFSATCIHSITSSTECYSMRLVPTTPVSQLQAVDVEDGPERYRHIKRTLANFWMEIAESRIPRHLLLFSARSARSISATRRTLPQVVAPLDFWLIAAICSFTLFFISLGEGSALWVAIIQLYPSGSNSRAGSSTIAYGIIPGSQQQSRSKCQMLRRE
jgi:hypothetical protein